jgi:DNA-binding beta-propeller fold protein YncE
MPTMRLLPLLLLPLVACAKAPPPPAPLPALPATASPSVATAAVPQLTATPIALPGATGSVSLDYLAIDRAAGRVWIPAGETGSVDVLDAATGKLTRIEGFPTAEREGHSGKRVVGPSSATVGRGVVYVGNRANSEVCAVDAATLARGACVTLPSAPDGLAYVAATHEVWATTPKDSSITVLDASTPQLVVKTKIALEGAPEGYAVDEARGIFYTNLEDKNKTLTLDVKTHRVTATWEPHCGDDGPRGLAVDPAKGFLFVACTDHVVVLDTAHGGALLSRLDAGAGVDNVDYLDARGLLYIAAGKTGTLTVAHVDDKGALAIVAAAPSAPGARVVVAGRDGAAYVADGKQGRVIAFAPVP